MIKGLTRKPRRLLVILLRLSPMTPWFLKPCIGKQNVP
jgi:hypothetical protein